MLLRKNFRAIKMDRRKKKIIYRTTIVIAKTVSGCIKTRTAKSITVIRKIINATIT